MQKDSQIEILVCAFGICTYKSGLYNVDEINTWSFRNYVTSLGIRYIALNTKTLIMWGTKISKIFDVIFGCTLFWLNPEFFNPGFAEPRGFAHTLLGSLKNHLKLMLRIFRFLQIIINFSEVPPLKR